jgi:hypothetical protein
MRFARIEEVLGRDAVKEVQRAVGIAFQTRCADHDGFCALRELLVGLLAAVVTTQRHIALAQLLAAEDAAQLNALVRKIQEVNAPQPSTVPITSVGCATQSPASTATTAADRSRRALLVSPRRARPRPHLAGASPVAGSQVGASGHKSVAASMQAQSEAVRLCRTSIFRLRERIEDAHATLSRSQALLAASRELTRSRQSAAWSS